jgi:hypothetical protein
VPRSAGEGQVEALDPMTASHGSPHARDRLRVARRRQRGRRESEVAHPGRATRSSRAGSPRASGTSLAEERIAGRPRALHGVHDDVA